jgi:hypothetical protein
MKAFKVSGCHYSDIFYYALFFILVVELGTEPDIL